MLLLAVWSCCSCSLLPAQYYFDRYTVVGEEEEVRGILQEGADGFIWIGAPNGLYRYDGRNFKAYHHDPDDSLSLGGQHIYSMVALDDKLWVGTEQGISIMDFEDHTFVNHRLPKIYWPGWEENNSNRRVNAIFRDRQGEIWVGTHAFGIWHFDPHTGIFTPHSQRKYKLLRSPLERPYKINAITQSAVNDSILWVGTSAGLIEMNKYTATQQLHLFQDEDMLKETAVNVILEVVAHENGLIYTGNWTEGVFTFDPATGQFQPLVVSNDRHSITRKSHVRSIYPAPDGQLWFTTSAGVGLYHPLTQRLTFAKSNDFSERDYYGISMIDRRGRIWYNSGFGIYLFDPQLQQFEEHSFRELYFRNDAALAFNLAYDTARNKVIVCPLRADGIYLWDRTDKSWEKQPFFPGEDRMLLVSDLTDLGQGQFLLTTREGIFRYNIHTRERRQVPLPASITPSNIRRTIHTQKGEIWISVLQEGVYRTDLRFSGFTQYKTPIEYGEVGLAHISTLFEDSHHNIWIKRRNGFSVYHYARDTFYNFLYPLDPDNSFPVVFDFAEDRTGSIWTCNGAGWLGYMEAGHPEKGLVRKIAPETLGGINGYISELTTDARGEVWGFTLDHILHIDPDSEQVEKFSFQYGAAKSEFFGFEILPDNKMFLGSWQSVFETDEQQLRKNDELPIPYLFSINFRNEKTGAPYPLFGKKPLHLKHHQNFFTLNYSAQAFTLGDKVTFRYRLQGFDDWKEVGNSQIATYTNVPSGDYTFELQAANNEGTWNEVPLIIPITIDQPWYHSILFYLGIVLFLGLFVLSVYQYRVNQIRNEARLKTDFEKKLASVEMNALLAQMNPHFIFNSLNSIDRFILKNKSRQASEYLNDFARLIRLILQNSRSESIRLSDEIETLELYLKMEQLRFKEKFSYTINIDPAVDVDRVEIPPMLVQPYVENAVWHGIMYLPEEEHGELRVDISSKDGTLTIQVTDNGVGRVRSREIKQRKVRHKQSMGMKITHDRIDLINSLYDANARIDIADLYNEEEKPTGTKVFITICT